MYIEDLRDDTVVGDVVAFRSKYYINRIDNYVRTSNKKRCFVSIEGGAVSAYDLNMMYPKCDWEHVFYSNACIEEGGDYDPGF